jgi:hypothetical protein
LPLARQNVTLGVRFEKMKRILCIVVLLGLVSCGKQAPPTAPKISKHPSHVLAFFCLANGETDFAYFGDGMEAERGRVGKNPMTATFVGCHVPAVPDIPPGTAMAQSKYVDLNLSVAVNRPEGSDLISFIIHADAKKPTRIYFLGLTPESEGAVPLDIPIGTLETEIKGQVSKAYEYEEIEQMNSEYLALSRHNSDS